MSETKFKAWDKINKRWLNVLCLTLNRDGSLLAVEDIEDEIYGLHQVEVMQFTGLTDRLGKEIYGGDIVKGKRLTIRGLEDCVGTVVYNENRTMFDIEGCGFRDSLWMMKEDIEVIGDIYSNAKLLEQADE